MLSNYIIIGIHSFLNLLPIALLIFVLQYAIKYLISFLTKRKLKYNIVVALFDFLWIATILAILKITGIIGGDFSVSSLASGTADIDLTLFGEGLTTATILNIVLFFPFGFFVPIIFPQLKCKWYYGVIFGVTFTFLIEFLQTFTGRFAQLDDIVMNTLGTFIGYMCCVYLLKMLSQVKK